MSSPLYERLKGVEGRIAPEADMIETRDVPLRFSVRSKGKVRAASMFTSSFSAATAAGLASEASRP